MYFLKQKFIRFVNAGLYFDFFLKKIGEIIVRNFFVYSALFFGEKYFIEVLTKKVIDSYIFNLSNKLDFRHLDFGFFFYQTVAIVFYSYFVFNIVLHMV